MGIIIEDIRYKDRFRPAETDVDWTMYAVGEFADIEIDFRVEEVIVNDASNYVDGVNTVVLEPESAQSGIADREGLIWSNNNNAFLNFNVGDTIFVSGAQKNKGTNNGTHTIIEKIDNGAIRVSSPITPSFLDVGGYVQLTTPFRGLRYFFNFIENNGVVNYQSQTTVETQLLTYDNTDNTNPTPFNMIFKGSKDYQIGGATIEGNGTSTYGQRFTLKHSTIVSPIYLEGQYDDLILRTKPGYFEADKCLKHIFKLEVNRDLSNPNDTQEIEYNERLGNTGWYNENYNGGDTNYSFSNVVITRVSDAATISELELTNACDVTFRVTNTVDSPFSNGNTKAVSIFYQLPQQNNYTNNGRDFQENFVYDYTSPQVLGAAAIGGTYGVAISEFETTFVDSQNIDVRVRISVDLTSQGYINENADKRYLIGFIVENHALTRETSDKVNLLINVNDFGLNLTKTDLITNTTKFLSHRYSDYTDAKDTLDVFGTDDVVAFSKWSIDFNGLENDGINIVSVKNDLVMTKSGFADIPLDTNTYATTSANFLNGYVPLIDVEQNRPFKMVDGFFRKLVQIKRDEASDSGTIYAYDNIYPFIIRWEYWEALSGYSNPPSGVYDSSLPNNGINHFWHRYQTLGYKLKYRQTFTILQNGEQFTQSFESILTSNDFSSNPEWTPKKIESFDLSANLLEAGGVKFLQTGNKTKLVATFTKDSGDLPLIDDVDIVFWGIVKEKGTYKSAVWYSSVYNNTSDTFFESVDGSNFVKKDKTSNVYTGEVLVDNNKLPNASDFTIYARIYDNEPLVPVNAKLMEDGTPKLMEDGTYKIIE